MSTKPATLPRWATNLTNNTAPLSGQQDTGWVPSQVGSSSFDNWAKYWTYKWIEWLNDGAVSFATISTTGNVTVGGTLGVTVSIAAPTLSATTITGTTVAATAGITAGTTIVASSTVTGTKLLHTSAESMAVPAHLAHDRNGSHTLTAGAQDDYWTFGATSNAIRYAIMLPAGAVIKSVGVDVTKSSGITGSITVRLREINGGLNVTTTAGTTNSTDAPGGFYLVEPGLSQTVLEGNVYYVEVFTNGAGAAGDLAFEAHYTFTKPA